MMIEIALHSIPRQLKALYTLIRLLPLLSWGITSSLVGFGFAYAATNQIRWFDYGLIVLLIVLIHGVLSHALNDREDWLSGADQLSPGILSGGSGVVARKQFNLEELSWVGKIALMTACMIGVYFIWQGGLPVLIVLAVGFWSAIAYSCPPLRLAYLPLAGEWLCGFPAVFGAAVGTFYVLTYTVQGIVLIAAAIHALLAIGLLMHHHLSDISSDLRSIPRKLTTVALAAITMGISKTPLIESFYFLLALLLGLAGTIWFHPVFIITIPVSIACIAAALTTIPDDIMSITAHEYLLYGLIIGDAVVKTAWLLCQPW